MPAGIVLVALSILENHTLLYFTYCTTYLLIIQMFPKCLFDAGYILYHAFASGGPFACLHPQAGHSSLCYTTASVSKSLWLSLYKRETGGRPDVWVGPAQVSGGARAAVIGRIGVDTSQRVGTGCLTDQWLSATRSLSSKSGSEGAKAVKATHWIWLLWC